MKQELQIQRQVYCFIGIDGSGKSTLARATLGTLQDKGYDCAYVWGRYGSVLVDRIVALSKKTVFRSSGSHSDAKKFVAARSWVYRNRFTALMYAVYVLIGYFWQILRKIWWPRMRGKNIICDRYVYDTVIDLTVNLNVTQETCSKIMKYCLRFAPKPDISFLVDLDEDVAYARKDDIPSLDYLRKRRELYRLTAEQEDMVVLDGTHAEKELQMITNQLIMKHIEEGSHG
jgi:dTMP kinase